MIKLKEQVKKTLIEIPETRNSDITLTIEIWKRFYGVDGIMKTEQLYDLPREDNVKRIRAKFCEKGLVWAYPTDWKIAKARGINENKWRQLLGYPINSEVSYPTRSGSYTEKIINVHQISSKTDQRPIEERTAKLF
jgi:hypothetical protein